MIYSKRKVALDDVLNLPPPKREADALTWQGMPHDKFVSLFYEIVEDRNWSLENPVFVLALSDKGLAASFDLVRDDLEPPEGTRWGVGIMHSNDRRYSMRLYGGLRLLESDSAVVFDELFLGKHDYHDMYRLESTMQRELMRFSRASKKYVDILRTLDERRVPTSDYGELLVHALRNKILPWRSVAELDKFYYGKGSVRPDRQTAWRVLQSFGVATRKGQPFHQMAMLRAFSRTVLLYDERMRRKEKELWHAVRAAAKREREGGTPDEGGED